MTAIDEWLHRASDATRGGLSAGTEAALIQRLQSEPPPGRWAARRETRRAVLCAAVAAVFTFGGAGMLTYQLGTDSRPTWVAAPASMSPYALLVER